MQKYTQNVFNMEEYFNLERKVRERGGYVKFMRRNRNGHSINVAYYVPETEAETTNQTGGFNENE